MMTKDSALSNKRKMERLTVIKERYHKLILKQRQEIEKEIQDDFKEHDDYDPETSEPTPFEVESPE